MSVNLGAYRAADIRGAGGKGTMDDERSNRTGHKTSATQADAPEMTAAKRPRRKASAAGDDKNGQNAGSVRWRKGKADVRLSLGQGRRKTFQLPTCKTEAEAEKRRALLAELAAKLRAAGRVDMGLPLLERAAEREGTALADVVRAIEAMCKGEVIRKPTGKTTFRQVAEQWLSGELHRRFPDNIKIRKQAGAELRALERHVFPLIGDIPMSRFTLEHAQEVMRRLPKHHQPGTRRCMALRLHRVVALAVFPLNLLPHNPLPPGFVPPEPPPKAKSHLYPDEEAQLLGCREVELCDRVLYAFLDREGMRADEAFSLEPKDIDLERGAISLDENKTNDPRAWALAPDTVRALRVWFELRDKRSPYVFHRRSDLAERLRRDLQTAGIKREVLFEHNKSRQRLRAHDLRATFVTINLALNRTETWVMDRTGHRSSEMVNRYRRSARTFAELGLGPLLPMDEAIPEIAERLRAPAEKGAKPHAAADACRPASRKPATAPSSAPAQPEAAQPEAAQPEAAKKEERHANAGAPSPASAPPAAHEKESPQRDATPHPAPPASAPSSRAADTAPDTARGQDIMTAPPSWSRPGPSLTEAHRADATPPKTPGKRRTSRPADAACSISK
jgi:integrase